MLNAKQFAARLESIRKSDEKFRIMVAEALSFAIYHARNHGQKTPFINLQSACPGWLQKGLKSVALGKKKVTEQECEYRAGSAYRNGSQPMRNKPFVPLIVKPRLPVHL